MQVHVVTVTPEQAGTWLKANTQNRNLNTKLVTHYARQMIDGRWELNGEAIKIADDGTLLDGQHRLAAVAASGEAVPMLIVQGLPTASQDTMDSGRKRSTADVLAIHGENNSAVLASVARRVWMWQSGNYRFANVSTPSTAEIMQLLERSPGLRRSADLGSRTAQSFRAANATVTGTAHHILTELHEGDAAEFFAQVASGAGLQSGHPVLTLRDRLVLGKVTMKHVPFHQGVAFYFRAWNAVREGRELTRIVHTADEPMVMPL